MQKPGNWIGSVCTAASVLFFWTASASAVDITDKFSVNGLLSGAYQYETPNDAAGFIDRGRGAVTFKPEIGLRPTKWDEVSAKFGFAAGNGLNLITPFALVPWAASLEEDVKNINGRNRDYLLTAWYKHTFFFAEGHTLGLLGGIIDSTDYLDQNRYANDEYTQFMNEALVNGPNVFVPSYDIGGAAEWEMGRFDLRAAVMQVGENQEGNGYQFYGAQAGYTVETPLGEGTYRVVVNTTSADFSAPEEGRKESINGLILSFDQELGEILGAWIRFGRRDEKALTRFKDLYSGGINISGKAWGREKDNIGIGYAYLKGGNQDVAHTQVAEGYVRFQLTEVFAFTADIQYQQNRYTEGGGPEGFIYGVRLTAEF